MALISLDRCILFHRRGLTDCLLGTVYIWKIAFLAKEISDLSDIHWVISEWLCRCICRKALISNQDSRASLTERILRYELEKRLRSVKTKTDKVAHWLKNLSSWLSFQPNYTMDKWENMHWTWTGHGNQLLAIFDIFWQPLEASFAIGRRRLIFSSFWQLLNQGYISCGILVYGMQARGVSSEHMENMEMFFCSPT